jgi:hypothetical protein
LDQALTQQTLNTLVWLSLIAIAFSAIALRLAWSTRKTANSEKRDEKDFRPSSQPIPHVESRVDELVIERVDKHLRAALGQHDTASEFAKAVMHHPQFLEGAISSLTDRLSDPDDDLTNKLVQKMLSVTEGLLSQAETQSMLREAVHNKLVEEIPELLSDDDDIRGEMLGSFQSHLPQLIKELMSTNEEFKSKVAEALLSSLLSRMTDILEGN